MSPSWAVVGEPKVSTALEVVMKGRSEDTISENPTNLLTRSSVSEEKGATVLRFSRLLEPAQGRIDPAYIIEPNGQSNVIFAFGKHDRFRRHGPNDRGSVSVEWQSGTSSSSLSDSDLERAHGVFMLLAWMVLIPMGIIVARFFKDEEGAWFSKHKILMGIGIGFTLLGFILIIVAVSHSHADHMSTSHAQMGLVITILAVLHPIFAMFRNKKRELWEAQHKWTARLLYLLAFINCFLGSSLLASKGSKLAFSLFTTFFALIFAGVFIRLALRNDNAPKKKGGEDAPHGGLNMPWSPSPTNSGQLPDWATDAMRAGDFSRL